VRESDHLRVVLAAEQVRDNRQAFRPRPTIREGVGSRFVPESDGEPGSFAYATFARRFIGSRGYPLGGLGGPPISRPGGIGMRPGIHGGRAGPNIRKWRVSSMAPVSHTVAGDAHRRWMSIDTVAHRHWMRTLRSVRARPCGMCVHSMMCPAKPCAPKRPVHVREGHILIPRPWETRQTMAEAMAPKPGQGESPPRQRG
jgi:hypothetical protein